MSQNGKSPGRAAYEAYDAHLGPIDDPGYVGPHDVPLTPWEDVRSPEREAWEAAAQAAIAVNPNAEDYDLTAELLKARRQRDKARDVVAEMCAHWERIGTTREEDELMPGWRKRAGLKG